MRKIQGLILVLFIALAVSPALLETSSDCQNQIIFKPRKVPYKAIPPNTNASKMDKPGPVKSPDPYYTLKVGETEIYRDAKDITLAYYKPVIRVGRRTGTPLAEGVGDLASTLDGFRFQYYKFESGGSPKWASIQVVITAEKPQEVTLEAVQAKWKEVTRLIPLPLVLDASTGVRMTLPYPPRTVTFSELGAKGDEGDLKWHYLSTNTHPLPPDLLTGKDNNSLNESKARDFASLITSDLSDMPSFQPVLEVRAVYPGWTGASPLIRNLAVFKPLTSFKRLNDTPAPPSHPSSSATKFTTSTKPVTVSLQGTTGTNPPKTQPQSTLLTQKTITMRTRPKLQPALRTDVIRVFGELKPRQDIDYTYSDKQEILVRIPISYPKNKAQNYDYYFLSDSGRFGGPYFEPSTLPNRPQPAEPPEGFPGYWYESHSFGKRLIWPAPKGLKLRWEVESGLRPSCRFSMTSDSQGRMTGHIFYDLYPDFSTRQLVAAVDALRKKTGEAIDLLPFPDLLDANQITLASGNPVLQDLAASKRVSLTKLAPRKIDDSWFQMAVDIPVDDWANFTLFMKMGDLGAWDFGVLTGASSGTAEKVTFQLNGDLLKTIGGPVSASCKNYNADTGGYEVVLNNYGLVSYSVSGLRFLLAGEGQRNYDVWFDGKNVDLTGIGSASSFDQQNGMSGSVSATVKEDASAELKTLMDSGKYQSLILSLAPDMIGPSSLPEAAGGGDPDIQFSFLRSLCYQYIGSSEIIQVPVAPAELSQWANYQSGLVVLRFQGYVYTKELDLGAANKVEMRRLPREGAFAFSGKPGDADVLEYRAIFTQKDGTVVYLPAVVEGDTRWLTADISGVYLDMTQAQPVKR